MGDSAVPALESSGREPSRPDWWTMHQGDARELDSFLRQTAMVIGSGGEPFLQTTVTSPPYATLVDYGSDSQIGFGQSFDDYIASCRSVFGDLFRWTRDSGSMWVVADSFMGKSRDGCPSRLLPLPFVLAAEAESVGWTLRDIIIWRKDRTRPWSHRGKLRNGFEYVLFFVKSNDFVFHIDRLRDTQSLKSWWVKYPERHNPWGMAPDNVWDIPIPVQGSWDAAAFRHACPFPPELVRRMITLTSDIGDVVFDPFAGSGSVVAGSLSLGRRGLGLEINPAYVSSFGSGAPAGRADHSDKVSISFMTQRLLELRTLKYPKDLVKQVFRAGFTTSHIRAVVMRVESLNYEPARTGYGAISCFVVVADDLSEVERKRLLKVVGEVVGREPLTKYGLEANCDVVGIDDIGALVGQSVVSVYEKGRTWNADRVIETSEIATCIRQMDVPNVVPILSPLEVHQSLEEGT